MFPHTHVRPTIPLLDWIKSVTRLESWERKQRNCVHNAMPIHFFSERKDQLGDEDTPVMLLCMELSLKAEAAAPD